jgi:hypothetical protein
MKLHISIILGLIAGLIFSVAWYLLARSIGFYSVSVYIYTYFVKLGLILIGVFLSVLLVKRKNAGFLEFKTALQTGMIYAVVFAVVVALFNFIYYRYISPDTLDYFVSEARKHGETVLKLKDADLTKFMDAERTRLDSFTVIILPILFWGLIISLLAGAILQKKKAVLIHEN